jgi:hypothetical protein
MRTGYISLALAAVVSLAVGGVVGAAPATSAPATTNAAEKPKLLFRDNIKVEVEEKFFVVKSDGIPDHETGKFPNANNPNEIKKQNYSFKIPRLPEWSEKITKLPMGPIGVAVNGVPFYNPYTAEGTDAAKNEVFDECCGHPDQRGRYHYHIYPKCVKTPFAKDSGKEHSPLLGYAFDGYAIYGPLGEGGAEPKDLDECNGHTDKERGYHYHVTNKFPYIIGGYHGVVSKENLDRPGGRGGAGGPGAGARQGPSGGGEEQAGEMGQGRRRRPPEGGAEGNGPPPREGGKRPPPPEGGAGTQPGARGGEGPPSGDGEGPPRRRPGGRRGPPPEGAGGAPTTQQK